MSLPADTHVCFICPYIEPYLEPGSSERVGGAERQQHLLAQRLRDRGADVSFIGFEGDGDEREQIDGFELWRTLPPTNSIRRSPEVLFKLLRSIRRVDADLFYVRGNPPLCMLSSYCCRVLGEQLVYVVANDSNLELARLSDHHGMFEYTLPKLGYLDAMRRASNVVAQTAYQRDVLGDVFGIDSTVIPNGYTVPPAEQTLAGDERQYVLWVGSLDPDQKRPGRYLDVAEQLPAVQFRMIGSPDDEACEAQLRSRAGELDNLQFEGFVPPDEIDQYYRNALALVNTSAYEGFPNTYLEAWRYSVPVLELDEMLDGLVEQEKLGRQAGTVDELQQLVQRYWNDPASAAALGRRGRAFLDEEYSLDTVTDEYEAVFRTVLADS